VRRFLLALVCLLTADALYASTPAEAASIALKDVQKLPADVQINSRYFWLGAVPEKDREQFGKVFAFHVNCISRNADFVKPVAVVDDVWRIDIRDPEWKREVYEKLADVEPYFHAKVQTVLVPAVVTTAVIAVGDTIKTVRKCNAYWENAPNRVRGQIDAGDDFKAIGASDGKVLIDTSVGKVWVSTSDVEKVGSSASGGVAQTPQVPTVGQKVGDAVTASAPWLPAETMTTLINLTQSQVPLVRADWFFAQTCRAIGRNGKADGANYFDFLGVKNQKDAEDLAGLDRKKAQKIQREIAAIVAESGVALNNRQIFRFGTIAGSWWETRDVEENDGAKNATRQLDEDFKADALEVYFTLPNRLFGLLALNNKGELQATVPDKIASDSKTTSKDARIHSSLGCIRCHDPGLQPIEDWARQFYAQPPGDAKLYSPDYEKLKRLKRLYLTPLEDDYESDQAVYAKALKRLTGWKPAEAAKAYGLVWQKYADTSVTGKAFAFELGVPYETMIDAFKAYAKSQAGNLDPVLIGFIKVPEFASRREYIEEIYPAAQQALQAYKPPEKKKEENAP